MVAVPEAIAVTTPVSAPIDAVPGALLLQVPPTEASVSVTDDPIQALVVPLIADGTAFTVISVVAVQPADKV